MKKSELLILKNYVLRIKCYFSEYKTKINVAKETFYLIFKILSNLQLGSRKFITN